MTRPTLLRLLLLSALFAAFAPAWAQVDPRAAELLDGIAAEPTRTPPQLTAMELRATSTLFDASGATRGRSVSRTLVDFEGRRIRAETYQDGDLISVTVFAGDQGAMYLTLSGTTTPLGPDQRAALRESLDEALLEPSGLVPANYRRARYDGVVDYAGVVRGEQVTTFVTLPTGEEVPASFIFDRKGEIVASVQHSPQLGIVLQVFDRLMVVDGLLTHMDITLYRLEGNQVIRFSSSSLQVTPVEGPLEASLFTLPE